MKKTLILVLTVALGAGAFAASQLGAQTAGSGVPPALTIATQDPTTPTAPTTQTPPTTETTTTPESTTATNGSTAAPGATPAAATVQNIVEITRLVPAGTTAVTAYTVPAGVVLVVTDVVITNTGSSAACGGAVNRAGGAATTPTTPTAPTTQTPSTETTPPGATGTTTSSVPGSVTTSVAGTVTQTDSTVTGPLCVPAQTTTVLPLTTGIEFAAGQAVQLMNTPDAAAANGTAAGALGFHLRGLLVTTS